LAVVRLVAVFALAVALAAASGFAADVFFFATALATFGFEAFEAGRDDFAAGLRDAAVRFAEDFFALAITHSRVLRAQNQHV
jgi:hypothetical protein